MRRWLLLAPLAACTGLSGTDPGEAEALETHRGEGWALQLPSDARLRIEEEALKVDAADGTWWFDVRWAEGSPEAAVAAWAEETCATLIWDEPSAPREGVRGGSGICTIRHQTHWLLASSETHDGAHLVTTLVARREGVTLEDAWVIFARIPLSLAPGDVPLPTPEEDGVREQVREAAAEGLRGAPIPGGGVLSPRVAERLDDLWEARSKNPPPRRWAP